jgi:predicted metal-dependent hydrolase
MSTAKFSRSSPYRIRESRRAKHVSIRVSHLGEVEIVVPPRFDMRHLPEILERRKDWIAKTQQRIVAERQAFDAVDQPDLDPEGLPQGLSLRSLPEDWQIDYQAAATNQITARISGDQQLLVRGEIDQTGLCCKVLRQWLNRKAEHHLIPWLHQVSQEIDLPFHRAAVRGQKTLWGSCSSKKNISLNYKLLFLPPPLVRYVMIHELCHTIHLNHSEEFWTLVGEKEPDYRHLDQTLNKSWIYIPTWMDRQNAQ